MLSSSVARTASHAVLAGGLVSHAPLRYSCLRRLHHLNRYSVRGDGPLLTDQTVTQMRLGLQYLPQNRSALPLRWRYGIRQHSEPSQQCHRKANLYLGGWTKDVLIFAQIESKT